jgi:hypothetical protein
MVNAISSGDVRLCLSGENGGVVNDLQKTYKKAYHNNNEGAWKVANGHRKGAWKNNGAWNEHRLMRDLATFVKDMLQPPDASTCDYIGFKEIRHSTPTQVDFLMKMFPGAKFILNYREDAFKTLQSMRKTFGKAKKAGTLPTLQELDLEHQNLIKFSKTLASERVFHLPLHKFDVETFNKLIGWLGFEGCSFGTVLHDNRGTVNTGLGKGYNMEEKNPLQGTCVRKASAQAQLVGGDNGKRPPGYVPGQSHGKSDGRVGAAAVGAAAVGATAVRKFMFMRQKEATAVPLPDLGDFDADYDYR